MPRLAVDITVRSAVTSCGRARPNAATVDGAVLVEARHNKEMKCAELCRRRSMSTCGRWRRNRGKVEPSGPLIRRTNWQLHVHVKPLVHCGSPRFLLGGRGGVGCCLCRAGRAFAGSLVSSADDQLEGTDASVPELADLFFSGLVMVT